MGVLNPYSLRSWQRAENIIPTEPPAFCPLPFLIKIAIALNATHCRSEFRTSFMVGCT
ncbi:hypothetical protein COO91_10879 (plasmid) [Nostoc flagelliforme CCNUN1]|uniref:Uncharacterized protein n=1 Tax=Nostoc flagelliforme CCNUN1 TaxID=2038116 RepID=A0A2K8TAF4_9NOSO|nr:hypothetical protein COO91_10879 [Nostoc flagelliforme CCNUN1]